MRTAIEAGSERLYPTVVAGVVAQRWARQDPRRRADLVYQAATLAAAVLLLITATAGF